MHACSQARSFSMPNRMYLQGTTLYERIGGGDLSSWRKNVKRLILDICFLTMYERRYVCPSAVDRFHTVKHNAGIYIPVAAILFSLN